MARKAVLLISSIAVLLTLFFIYSRVVRDPVIDEPRDENNRIENLPQAASTDQGDSIDVGTVHVPPGGEIIFRVYDPNSGRPTYQMRCSEWSAVPGAKNEIFVHNPEMTMLLPSGMVAVISAAEAQFTVDRVQKKNMKPKLGWMRGDVKFTIDRGTLPDRPPIQERPQDAITITMASLDFDLDLGELKTENDVEVVSTDFEIRGGGLSLAWNQADNRIETLKLLRGDELVLWSGSGIFGNVMGSAAASETTASPPVATQPADDGLSIARRKSRKTRITSYECVLAEDVTAEQWNGDERVGALSASRLKLTFDIGSDATGGLAARRENQATSAPASMQQRERLVVKWHGPLTLGPTSAGHGGAARRRIDAFGPDVRLTRGDGTVRCGKLEFYDDTSQVWLYPAEDGLVHLAMGNDLNAQANSVYIDRARNIVKLIGRVHLESKRDAADAKPMRMDCSQWAELRVAAPDGATRESDSNSDSRKDSFEFGRLRSAEFIGDVAVDMRGQTLRCGRLNTEFRTGRPGESMGQLLTRAIAREGAHLARDRDRMRCQMLDISFGTDRSNEIFPQTVNATGNVRIAQGQTEILGERVDAQLAEAPEQPADKTTQKQEYVVRSVDIAGDAQLRDPGNQVEAEGDRISARFNDHGQLTIADVDGTPTDFGRIRSGGFSVRGATINVDRTAQTLKVPGRSALRFLSQTGLGGQKRASAQPIVVTSDSSLQIDGRANRVYFNGHVEAHSGNETLRADEMALHLEDAPPNTPAAPQPPRQQTIVDVMHDWRRLLPGTAPQQRRGRDLITSNTESESLSRKEPIRLVATNAVVVSEIVEANDPVPLVHSSITAPTLDVEIPKRVIRTTGHTTLLITDRRLRGLDEEQTRAGLPSALVTRGPSQSAMQCENGMTYRVGDDGAIRTDSVTFDKSVVFVHRAGRDMVELEQMLPQLQNDKELLDKLKSRNTYLECDRLEVGFQSRGDSDQAAGGALASGMRLSSLVTSGNAYLVDREGDGVRTVNADRMEFDRERGLLRVYGTPTADARVYYENPTLKRFDAPAVGPRFIIDLNHNTVEAGNVSGEVRR